MGGRPVVEIDVAKLAQLGCRMFASGMEIHARVIHAAASLMSGLPPAPDDGGPAFDHSSLDSMAKELAAGGYADEAALVAAAATVFAGHGRFSLSQVTARAVLTPNDWAEVHGKAVHRHRFPAPWLRDLHLDPNLLPVWRQEGERFAAEHTGEAMTIDATDATASSFGWELANGAIDEQHDVFAANGDMITDEPFWLPYFMGRFNFRCLGADSRRVLIDLSGSREERLDFPAAMMGSKANWGHWLIDYMSRLRLYRLHPEKERFRLVFGKLNAQQKKCLAIFGIDPDGVAEMPYERLGMVRWRFPEMMVLPRQPTTSAFEFVREGFARRPRDGKGPRLIFRSRRNLAPRHRINNDAEVGAFLEKRGFETVLIETLSFEGQLDVMADAEVIVMCFGGDTGNLAICNPRAVVVMLTSREYAANVPLELMKREVTPYVFGVGLPTIPVFGTPIDPNDNTVNALADYDLRDIDDAIGRAMEIARQRR